MEIKIYRIMSDGHSNNFENNRLKEVNFSTLNSVINMSEVERYKYENEVSEKELFFINIEKPSEIAVYFNENKEKVLSLNLWNNRPDYKNKKTSYIGNIKIYSEKSEEYEKAFNEILDMIKNKGTEIVIGPLNGTTWNNYRYVVESDEIEKRPAFFMEPESNERVTEMMKNTEFYPLTYYFSTIMEDIRAHEKLDMKIEKIKKLGLCSNIKIETAENKNLDNVLEKIYDITTDAFKNNFLYTPMEKENFLRMYRVYEDKLIKKFLKLAFFEGEPVGYIFGIPDYEEIKYKGKIETGILKTIGVYSKYHGKGIGYILISSLAEEMEKSGYKKMICALMHENNISLNIGLHIGSIFRKYALFIKKLI